MLCKDFLDKQLSDLKKFSTGITALDLRILLAHVLGIEASEVYFLKCELSNNQIDQFNTLLKKRINHCPTDKIIGHKGFYKYEFMVDENVLSPRPDTEVLVEVSSALIASENIDNILEFGVGSGCIVLSLLADNPNLTATGIDISNKALAVAKTNAVNLGVAQRIKFINASWFDNNIEAKINGHYDLIISNPPYIPSAEIDNLDDEVKCFDPRIALDGGTDGLRDYRQIVKLSSNLLNDGGLLIFEIGEMQKNDVVNIAAKQKLSLVNVLRDLSGTERCIILKK